MNRGVVVGADQFHRWDRMECSLRVYSAYKTAVCKLARSFEVLDPRGTDIRVNVFSPMPISIQIVGAWQAESTRAIRGQGLTAASRNNNGAFEKNRTADTFFVFSRQQKMFGMESIGLSN